MFIVDSGCPDKFHHIWDTGCYYVGHDAGNFNQVNQSCVDKGSHLAVIEGASELQILSDWLSIRKRR